MQDILVPDHVVCGLAVASKKQLFQTIAETMGEALDIGNHMIMDVLCEREKLGTTGVGQGIAIPHGRIVGLTEVHGFFARLATPLAFGSQDEQPVDLVFALLAPAEAGSDHLRALGMVAEIMRDATFCAQCRKAKDTHALYALVLAEAQARAA